MSNYLKLSVPINRDAEWYQSLRRAVGDACERWSDQGCHITVVFCEDDTHVEEMRKKFGDVLHGRSGPVFRPDRIDVFQTLNGKDYIVHLTTSDSSELIQLVGELRLAAEQVKVAINPFRFHVTLGRVPVGTIAFERLQEIVSGIQLPLFQQSVHEVQYRYFEPKNSRIDCWMMR